MTFPNERLERRTCAPSALFEACLKWIRTNQNMGMTHLIVTPKRPIKLHLIYVSAREELELKPCTLFLPLRFVHIHFIGRV